MVKIGSFIQQFDIREAYKENDNRNSISIANGH